MNTFLHMVSRKFTTAIAVGIAFAISGCGGSDGTRRADSGPVHYYISAFRSNQSLSVVTFHGGLVYGLYQSDFSQPTFPEFAYAGFFVGQPREFGLSNERVGFDFSFDAHERSTISFTNVNVEDQTFTATLNSASGQEFLGGSRATVDNLPTDTSTLPGSYAVRARSVTADLKATASLSGSGALQSDLGNGCLVTGQLTSRTTGNLYDATAVLGNGCSLGSGSFSGHAFQSYGTRNLYVLLTNEAGDGVLLLLVPQ